MNFEMSCFPFEFNMWPKEINVASEKTNSKDVKGRRGRHRKNLLDTLMEDLKMVKISLEDAHDLAKDEQKWEKLKNNKQPERRSQRIAMKLRKE